MVVSNLTFEFSVLTATLANSGLAQCKKRLFNHCELYFCQAGLSSAVSAQRCGGIPEVCLANEKQVAGRKQKSFKDKCKLPLAIIEGR